MNKTDEERHLKSCVELIKSNIDKYRKQTEEMDASIKDMYEHYHSDSTEMYTELSNTITMNDSVKRILMKNERALPKPYFGRIDFHDKEMNRDELLYIGKNGIMRTTTCVEVVDWRAPISTVYYENELGGGTYPLPDGKKCPIELKLKRTYEIDKSRLVDFYDSDTIANDELLTKYLARNKEEVLGEIIATIQKEQNEIIRFTPFRNVIVQGVAGSGKTTVAMHRISYILFNYAERFHPSEFYVIGSNEMLLNYITSVLPELDVHNIKQMTLETFFARLLDDDYKEKKSTIIPGDGSGSSSFAVYKGSLQMMSDLREFINRYEHRTIPADDVKYGDKMLYSHENIIDFISENENLSLQDKIDVLNMRLLNKLENILLMQDYEKKEMLDIMREYRGHFGGKKWHGSIMEIYLDYVLYMMTVRNDVPDEFMMNLQKNRFDVYDLAALCYIRRRIKLTEVQTDAAHIVFDEAQDYGTFVFAVLKHILPRCTFTIMGDVSQNINYDSGMNSWEELQNEVFTDKEDYFSILAKSYRNTIEISEYASTILAQCSFKTYKPQPIIRHGKPVEKLRTEDEGALVHMASDILSKWRSDGYDTIAVICRDNAEALDVQKKLKTEGFETYGLKEAAFAKGIMVLPIKYTKGLEFDTVLLWNPDDRAYPRSDGNAKQLYVAATRALHELKMIYTGTLAPQL